MVWCYKCQSYKEKEHFYKDKSRYNGLRSSCKACGKTISKEHKRRKAEREGRKMKEYQRKPFAQLTEKELLSYLQKFHKENKRPPTSIDLEGNPGKYPHCKTYYRRFGKKLKNTHNENKWDQLLKLAGLEPIDYDRIWRAWEYIVEMIITRIYQDYAFQVPLATSYRPDAVIESKKLIIDAATSNYDSSHKMKQFDAARACGYEVEYWCLYKTTKNGINERGVKYVFVDEIKEKLRAIGEERFIKKIDRLLLKKDQYAKEIEIHRKKYIISKIKEMAELKKRTPFCRDFEKEFHFPSSTTIRKWFGSYNKALEAAGFAINKISVGPHDPLIAFQDLIAFMKENNRLPTTNELGGNNTTYTYKVYSKYGGIKPFLRLKGFDVDGYIRKLEKKERKENLQKIKNFYIEHERLPYKSELAKRNNLPSRMWVDRYFDSIHSCYDLVT